MDWTVQPWFKRQGMAIVAPEDGPALATRYATDCRPWFAPGEVRPSGPIPTANGAAVDHGRVNPAQPAAAWVPRKIPFSKEGGP